MYCKRMLSLRFANVMADRIGFRHGLTERDLDDALRHRKGIIRKLARPAFAKLPYDTASVEKISSFARHHRPFKNFVHIGIGGSALGAIALHRALSHRYHNLLTSAQRNSRPRLFFLDNIDPDEIDSTLRFIRPRETLFHVVTKSGETTETIALLMIWLERLRRDIGSRWRDHLIITTDPKEGPLRRFAHREKIFAFGIPPGVGGRFSVFTAVGLLPAAFAGIDIDGLIAGAKYGDELSSRTDPKENPAFLAALLHVLLDQKKGKNIHVFMPYARTLKDVADWFRQLWAESLGKNGIGPTPVPALGATDQHSQIQLYNEGPNNKLISFLVLDQFQRDVTIPHELAKEEACSFLGGHTLSKVLHAEKQGTEAALTAHSRPNLTYTLKELSPKSVGTLLFVLEMQTVYAGTFYGVNPFNQPGVEAGKRATYKLLGRNGYMQE